MGVTVTTGMAHARLTEKRKRQKGKCCETLRAFRSLYLLYQNSKGSRDNTNKRSATSQRSADLACLHLWNAVSSRPSICGRCSSDELMDQWCVDPEWDGSLMRRTCSRRGSPCKCAVHMKVFAPLFTGNGASVKAKNACLVPAKSLMRTQKWIHSRHTLSNQ